MFNLPQIIVTGRIKENREGNELLCFDIKLGPMTLVCIANIPDEDQDEAPVYVKFKINTRLREERDVRQEAA
jgi:hypothetical protein